VLLLLLLLLLLLPLPLKRRRRRKGEEALWLGGRDEVRGSPLVSG